MSKFKQTVQCALEPAFLLRSILIIGLIVFMTHAASYKVKGTSYDWDALENTVAAYHLSTIGTISHDGNHPGYLREPLPIALLAAHMVLFTDIPSLQNTGWEQSRVTPDALLSQVELHYPSGLMDSEHYLKQIGQLNLWIAAAGMLVLWWLSWMLMRSHVFAGLTVIASWLFFYYSHPYLSEPRTEFLAAFLMTLAVAGSVMLYRYRSIEAAVLTGLSLGALSLTKAAVFYVGLVVIPMLILFMMVFRMADGRRLALLFASMLLSFALLVLPWMARNLWLFDDFAIAQRGGTVLMLRAEKNRMTAEEYAGAFYAYAPVSLKRILFEPVFDYSEHDMQPDGRLGRLVRNHPGDMLAWKRGDPGGATSFFSRVFAYQNKLLMQGIKQEEIGDHLMKIAKISILNEPLAHIAAIPVFAWREIWSFVSIIPERPGTGVLFYDLVNFFSYILLLAMPVIALCYRKPELLAFSLAPAGLFWFYAVLTHAIPRYSAPLIPLALLSLFYMLKLLLDYVASLAVGRR